LIVGGPVSYLRYLCLFVYSGVQHMLSSVFCFVCLRIVSCVPNVANFFLIVTSVFSNIYLTQVLTTKETLFLSLS
jgi:hypothetical protein